MVFSGVFEARFERVTIFLDVSDSTFRHESEYTTTTAENVHPEDYFILSFRLLVSLCIAR